MHEISTLVIFVPDLSTNLEAAIQEDNLVISWTHLKPRNRKKNSAETLLALDFPGSENKIVLTLDRHEKKGEYKWRVCSVGAAVIDWVRLDTARHGYV